MEYMRLYLIFYEMNTVHTTNRPNQTQKRIGKNVLASSFGFIFGKVAGKVFAIKCVIQRITSPSKIMTSYYF